MTWHRRDSGDLLLELRIQPRAAREELITAVPRPRLRVRAPATDDRANRAAMEWLARAFGVANSNVELVRGRRGRDEQFRPGARSAAREARHHARHGALARAFCMVADWL
jgi:uncharacterized protein (TIGR00251 family)